MVCNCASYNLGGKGRPEVIVETPSFLRDFRTNDTICLDACIAETIKHLWSSGVVTLGCCCGHNKFAPSIVLGNTEDPIRAEKLIAAVDDREFDLMQWKLRKVNP